MSIRGGSKLKFTKKENARPTVLFITKDCVFFVVPNVQFVKTTFLHLNEGLLCYLLDYRHELATEDTLCVQLMTLGSK